MGRNRNCSFFLCWEANEVKVDLACLSLSLISQHFPLCLVLGFDYLDQLRTPFTKVVFLPEFPRNLIHVGEQVPCILSRGESQSPYMFQLISNIF